MKIILFNDQPELLYPLTRLRPTWEVNIGGRSLLGVLKRNFPGVKILFSDLPPASPARLAAKRAGGQTPLYKGGVYILYLNGRLLPDDKLIKALSSAIKAQVRFSLKKKGTILIKAEGGKAKKINTKGLELMDAPWDLIRWHNEILLQESSIKHKVLGIKEIRKNVFADKSVKLPDICVTRTEKRPIVIEKGAQIGDFTVLEGPLLIGENSIIHDFTKLSRSRIGKSCKIAGEINDCNFYEYSNKQHFGFAGNSIIGAWANLGGGTITSNLKNTFGTIRMNRGLGPEETKMQFAGSILGDHVKTAINSTLMAGLVADINAHLYGTAKGFIPAFANSVNGKLTELPIEVALKTAQRMKGRRRVKLSAAERKNLRAAFKQTAEIRKKLNVGKGKLILQ